MIVPCEIAAKAIVPTIRAMIAKELSQSYKMKQDDIAERLGITQSAVSQYLGNIRGKALDLGGVTEIEVVIKDLAYILAAGTPDARAVGRKYCETCRIIREKRLLCQLHKRLDPLFNTKDCDLCISTSTACL